MIRLRLLGETAIDVDDASGASVPVGPDSHVLFALLLVLALERGRRLARPALHQLLWPAADEESGRHSLRQVLYKLRQLGVPIDATQSSVMLPAGEVSGEIVELTSGGRAIGARLVGGRRVGELLPGYAPAFSAPFSDWVDEQRALLNAQLRRSLLAALAEARALGQWREVEAIAREVLRFDALNEEATLALAEATALVGAKAQALGIIDRYLDEVGTRSTDLRLPATVLRRRIAERFPTHRYVSAADACFVGRATEMAALLGVWHRAREHRGSAVLLWGEPGIGKTRLAHELARVATLQGAQVQRVASRSWDVQRPLGAIVDLVPPLRELPGAAGIDPRCNEYLDRLTKHDPDRPLTDLPDPATLHRQVRQAVFDLIDALLAEAPLVLVLEDVQWLDASSWEVVAELLRLARTRRLLLVLTSRVAQPAQMPESEDWEALRRVRLDGIDQAATSELLDAMTREAGKYIDPDYREWCVPLANGNPLHVQEIALQWLEKGSVREAPGSLKAMIEARIGALSSPALEALRVATLLNENAQPDIVSRVLGESLATTLAALHQLEGAGLLRYAVDRLAVRHHIIAEMTEHGLSEGSRVLLHGRCARSLSTSAVYDRKPSLLWACFQHATAARMYDDATQALIAFADHLLLSGRADTCENLLQEALNGWGDIATAHAIRAKLVEVSSLLGHWRQATMLWDEHAVVLQAGQSEQLLRLYEARWHQDGDIEMLKSEALSLATRGSLPARVRVRAATWALVFAENSGDKSCHLATERAIRPLLGRLGKARIYGVHYRMMVSAQQGAITETGRAARELALLAASLDNSAEKTRMLRQAAHGLGLAGFTQEAQDALLQALDVGLATGARHSVALCEESMAGLQFYQHNLQSARAWTERAANSYGRTEDSHGVPAMAFLELQFAAVEGRCSVPHSLLEALGEPNPRDTNLARRTTQLAAQLRFAGQALSSDEQVERAIDQCLAAMQQNRANNFNDFVASAVAHAMCTRKQAPQAAAFLNTYLSKLRLRQGPLHLDLFRLTRDMMSGTVSTSACEP